MHSLTPDAALVARFRADFEALAGQTPDPAHLLGLAVSGGADSMALLLLAAAAYPRAIAAATVNHGLRPEAADEVAMVARTCAMLGVPHRMLVPTEAISDGNLQEEARLIRYALLGGWAVAFREDKMPWVAVAHHRDDVAETFLQRARRGSGVGGLAAMRRARPIVRGLDQQIVRPLLDWSRDELAAIVADAGAEHADDPSNRAVRFDRSRIRALLAASPELPPARLARAAANLRHAEDALAWWFEREREARIETDRDWNIWIDPGDLPYELRRRLIVYAIHIMREENAIYDPWRETGIDRLIATLEAGGTGTIARVQARPISGKWHLRMAPPRRNH